MPLLIPAVRNLLRSPLYALTVILSVALVVAVNASAFASLWALGWQALPYRDADRLVQTRIDLRQIDFQVGLSPSMLDALRARTETFAGAFGWVDRTPGLDTGGRVWQVQRITADFTQVLGVVPLLGSALDRDGIDAAVPGLLLSDRSWREWLHADPAAIGQPLRIGRVDYRVVGVMPPGFAWPDTEVHAWTPYQSTADERAVDEGGGFGIFHVSARLADGVNLTQARQALTQVLGRARNSNLHLTDGSVLADVRPWRESLSAGFLQQLWLLQAAALVLWLIAAINLAGLTLDRLWARRRDHAVQTALGAQPRQLLAAVLFDLAAPTVIGVLIGLALVNIGITVLTDRGLLPMALPIRAGADAAPLLFGLLTGVAALVIAALIARIGIARIRATGDSLGERAPISALMRSQTRMLVAQIALTMVLAGAATLLLRSAWNLDNEPRGFDARGVLLTQIDFGDPMVPGAAATLAQAVAALPGVTHVASADMPPFGGAEFLAQVRAAGDAEATEVRAPSVGPGYFAAMGIRLLAGSDFVSDGADVAIVDQFYAQRFGSPGNAIGQTLRIGEGDDEQVLRIVGVAANVKQKSLTETDARGTLYQPIGRDWSTQFLVTRSSGSVPVDAVRRLVAQTSPDAKLMVNLPLGDAVARTQQTRRALMESVGVFALATLALGALGLYAVLSAAVRRRGIEYGVRMALGARRHQIVLEVFGHSGRVVGIGLLLGLGSGLLLARLLAEHLHRLAPADPFSWVVSATVIAVIALAAGLPPALRATRIPPRVALAPPPGTGL